MSEIVGRCATCRWWDRHEEPMIVTAHQDWRQCEYFDRWAAEDGEGHKAVALEEVTTAPDFGCTEWKARA